VSGPYTLAITPSGDRIYIGSEGGVGGIELFELDGSTVTATGHHHRAHFGDTTTTVRVDATANYVLANDPGEDAIFVMGVDSGDGTLTNLPGGAVALPGPTVEFVIVPVYQ